MANPTNKPRDLDKGASQAKSTLGAVAEKAQSVGSAVVSAADSATSTVGGGIKSAADSLKQVAPHEGMAGAAASAVADTVKQAGEYLQREGLSGAADDMLGLVRSYPVTAVLVGVSLGFLLACATSSRD